MSADNWAVCPRCKIRIEKEKQKLLSKVEESYGKIDQKKWEQLKSDADFNATKMEKKFHTLREDYELGVCPNGEFSISYHAHCEGCKLSFNFKHAEMVNLEG